LTAQGATRIGTVQQILLVLLRVGIGWHFLYEGYVKLTAKSWSAAGYLAQAQGPLAGWFHHLAQNQGMLHVVDLMNAYGLTIVGACLILGLATPLACLGAMALLALYYLASPPWIAVLPRATEGNYLLVDKNVVEFLAVLVLLAFNTGRIAGLDVLFHDWMARRAARAKPTARV
jgi:thiosulfate dehydrogenase [quinone] large subunit